MYKCGPKGVRLCSLYYRVVLTEQRSFAAQSPVRKPNNILIKNL